MYCASARELSSARLDGQTEPWEDHRLQTHLDSCPPCRAWGEQLPAVGRRLRVRSAESPPDLTERVLTAAYADGLLAPAHARRGRLNQARGVLAGLVLVQLTLVVSLVTSAPMETLAGPVPHQARHLVSEGLAWQLALAVGLLYAAVRPARAAGLLPVMAVLAAVQLAGAVLDVSGGHTYPASELLHLLTAVEALVLWAVSRLATAEPTTIPRPAGPVMAGAL